MDEPWSRAVRPAFAFVIAVSTSAPGTAGSRDESPVANAPALFSGTELYPAYLADPHRAGFGFQALSVSGTDIPLTGTSRYEVRMGGRLGVLNRGSAGERGSWELSLDMGFTGQFDRENSDDNIGWDGIYGATFGWTLRPDLRAKVGIMHWSSHVGDEYAERTGRRRINYTREEFLAGVGWLFRDGWRAYADYGHAYDLRNADLQEPGRIQLGLEFDPTRPGTDERRGWYAALDLTATEERDWRWDSALQAGYVIEANGRRWRFGLKHYRGRPPMGEFFQFTETYTALGVWLDL